jgi:acyl-CoA thioester hydrolase
VSDPHVWPVRVYYEDTDAGGVAYHAAYLRFAERARTEALRALGVPHAEMLDRHGVMFVVRRLVIDYVRPALLDESLLVETAVVELGGASMRLRQTVRRDDGQERASLDVSLACVSRDGLRPARMPARWRQGLASILIRAEAG